MDGVLRMGIRYIEGLQSLSSAKYAVVDIDDIYLDNENPRFASSPLIADKEEITQVAIINYLIQYGEVYDLAQRINDNRGLFNETIASAYINNGKVIVLEGNRRIAACKILLDNNLVKDEFRNDRPIPGVSEDTRKNIKQINLIIYDESIDAQKYIASKHTQPDVKKWTTIEQYNYYYSQYTKGKTTKKIAEEASISNVKSVEDKIRQYTLFKDMFKLVQSKHPDIRVETTSILPVIAEFMPKLLVKGNAYSIDVETDASFKYTTIPSKAPLFNKILQIIGEAFFARAEAKKINELIIRPQSDVFRISTDEIKGKNKVNKLIDEDIRIPGLKDLLLEFRNDLQECNLPIESNISLANSQSEPQDKQTKVEEENLNSIEIANPHGTAPKTFQSPQTRPISSNEQSEFNQKERQLSFFSDLHFQHLDPANPDNNGLIAVAKEIKEISTAYNYSAYYKFPIASVFLLRSLIEQVIKRQLKKCSTYESIKSGKQTPELASMINKMIKDFENGSYGNFNDDRQLGKSFLSCFKGLATKDQLDTVIHRPEECLPSKDFLDNLSKSGLKNLLQKFIDSFS